MDLTALPVRLVRFTVMGRRVYGVWSSPLDAVVFTVEDSETARTFLRELRALVDSGMSHGAAVALLYSVISEAKNTQPWSTHGHWIAGGTPSSEDMTTRPALVAKCGGPAMCRQCSQEQMKNFP